MILSEAESSVCVLSVLSASIDWLLGINSIIHNSHHGDISYHISSHDIYLRPPIEYAGLVPSIDEIHTIFIALSAGPQTVEPFYDISQCLCTVR